MNYIYLPQTQRPSAGETGSDRVMYMKSYRPLSMSNKRRRNPIPCSYFACVSGRLEEIWTADSSNRNYLQKASASI